MYEQFPCVEISSEMLEEAERIQHIVKVSRTQASCIDTLTGVLGEFVFAEWLYGDWRRHRVTENKGRIDYDDVGVEVKTSAFPLSKRLHLLVREDYAEKRKPSFYVQVIIDVEDPKAGEIKPGTRAYLVGWATSQEVGKARKRDMGTKLGKSAAGYKCYIVPIAELRSMHELRIRLKAK